MTQTFPPPRAYGPGDEILGLRLVEKLGDGPQRAAFTAKNGDGRTHVVKVFSPESDEIRALFERGLEVLARANETPISGARLLPLSTISTETRAYVADYFENGNAAGIPALGWKVERTVEFFSRVCRAVAVLHQAGVHHLSLKPSNVLIDDALEPVLADAGMPMLRDPNVPLSPSDALYRAPEELDGTSGGGAPADVYGLGRLLWFLLLGADPDEPYVGLASLASLGGKPQGLIRIVRKATALDPAVRYPSVEALEADLVRYKEAHLVGLAADAMSVPVKPTENVAPPRARKRRFSLVPGTSPGADRAIGIFGLVSVALATTLLFLVPVPSPTAASVFGAVATFGLSLGTLLLKPYEARPTLFRLVTIGAVLALLLPLELDRLVIVRWKLTLASGSAEDRPRVARLLARWGARDLRGAALEKGDFRLADLGRADLRNANLSHANLKNSNLSESNLAGARVHGADLKGADLMASNIHQAEGWLDTHCDRSTAMPDRWRCHDGHPARRE